MKAGPALTTLVVLALGPSFAAASKAAKPSATGHYIQAPAPAGWTLLPQKHEYHTDYVSPSVPGTLPTSKIFSVLVDFHPEMLGLNNGVPYTSMPSPIGGFLSATVQMEVDCASQKTRRLNNSTRVGHMGQGAALRASDPVTPWASGTPNDVSTALACS